MKIYFIIITPTITNDDRARERPHKTELVVEAIYKLCDLYTHKNAFGSSKMISHYVAISSPSLVP